MPAGDKFLISEIARKSQMIAELLNENEELHNLVTKQDAETIQMRELLTPAQQKKLEVLLQDQTEPG